MGAALGATPDATRQESLGEGVTAAINTATGTSRADMLVVYTTPNGSSAMETLGRRPRSQAEWRFDVQHVLAQARAFRALRPGVGACLVVLEAPGKSWPAWRARNASSPQLIARMVAHLRAKLAPDADVALIGHSGGGSFLLGLLEAGTPPTWLRRLAFLDANYSFDHAKHAEPLLAWLDADKRNRLIVLAYDDRTVEMDGKPIVGPDGGTHRATARMRAALDAHRPLRKQPGGDWDWRMDEAGQIDVRVHLNHANAILHTALVGDMNGVLHALCTGDPDLVSRARCGEPRAYTEFIEPAEAGPCLQLPPRTDDAETGADIANRLAGLGPAAREDAMAAEALKGDVPDFLRQLRKVTYKARDPEAKEHEVAVWVTPDYLSLGCDDDYLRTPMTPRTAQRVADRAGCILPTPRIVDEVYRAAECRLAPRPMLWAREAMTTFVQHNAIIQEQRRTTPNGPIVAGIMKDIVICRDLPAHPGKVAIYGWHRLDGKPIQPVSLAHSDRYVDYSHGVRLVWSTATVDGKEVSIVDALHNPNQCWLFSDEGPLSAARYATD